MARDRKGATRVLKHDLPDKQILAQGKCLDCGGPVQVKIQKGGFAYYMCNNIDAETLLTCAGRHTYGRKASEKFIRQFKDQQNAPQTANENRSPDTGSTAGAPERGRGRGNGLYD